MTRTRTVRTLLGPLVFLAVLGCGKGSGLHDVSGTVTFKGQPVPGGWVVFTPDNTKRNDGPQGRAPIRDGSFDTAATNGMGTLGGPMVVRIQGEDSTGANAKALFAPYDMPMELPKERTTKDLQVPDAWANVPIPAPPP